MVMRRIFAVIAIMTAMITMASCEKYEDGRPSKDVRNEFSRMYPDAWGVEWELERTLKGSCWEVEFYTGTAPDQIKHTAWYDGDGNWLETETELRLTSIPQEIKDLISTEFVNSMLAEHSVEYHETPTGNFYRFDVYVNGIEVEVDVTEEGKVSLAGNFKF